MTLFRQQAIDHQQTRLQGGVLLYHPISIHIKVLLIVLIAVMVTMFIYHAEYTRKETVRGYLLPSKGVIKSYSQYTGIVEKVWVNEGDIVEKGDVLFTLSSHQHTGNGNNLTDDLIKNSETQLSALEGEIEQYRVISKQQQTSFKTRQSMQLKQLRSLQSQLELAEAKYTIVTEQFDNVKTLNQQGYVSEIEIQNRQQLMLEHQQNVFNVKQQILQNENQFEQYNIDHLQIIHNTKEQISRLNRQYLALESQLSQLQTTHRYSVVASHTGTVTAIQAVLGESIKPNTKPLLHIIPNDAKLEAELLLPTRSAGFVKRGDQTRMRFDAFPYQRFGFVQGQVQHIDNTIISSTLADLPVQLAEPVYRLRASLARDKVVANQQEFDLKSGMLFEADILLETRTLFEWLLDPLQSLQQ